MKKMWIAKEDKKAPYEVKKVLGKKVSMFNGTNQHDSNEWLTYFCDNIHEDLNRVIEKPYVERPENKEGKFSDQEMS